MTTHQTSATARELDVELLALDLASCTRCVGTLANVEAAIDTVRDVLAATGTTVRLRRILVESEDDARRHRFVSSPTVRVAGRDIVFDTLESRCDSCTDLCGCDEGTSCRVWQYQGEEHTEAPVGLVVEALLREIAGGASGDRSSSPTEEAASYEVPANLAGFFAGKAARSVAAAGGCCPSPEPASCCGPAEQATCCDPADKATCCSEPEPAACGCR